MLDSRSSFRFFRDSDSGAVSSDWTVIAAMVCSIGLAGILTLQNGVGDLGEGIDRSLSMAHIGAVTSTGAATLLPTAAHATAVPAPGSAARSTASRTAAATPIAVGQGAHWVRLEDAQGSGVGAARSGSGPLSAETPESLRARYDGAVQLGRERLDLGDTATACAQIDTAASSRDELTRRGLFVSDLGAGLGALRESCTAL
ncbi:hypothetical protein C4N9_17225 [Pararhodobacter marinus]|uniref:Uncharacterized protein n=1 Tax=Pararhodobacter marinus TaxID=2184063 RepID=A0A2U2C681_9RHOB|nr:hypothetical protein [Pararhodobacter marinus]PWE27398.1 hypothetical protein C4N9_17225 [Pararhodobacter marinus]